jgi:hypothetical protein
MLAQYDPNYVSVSSLSYSNEKLTCIAMARGGNRVKAKYFASRDFNGATVYQRFLDWSKNKKLIAISSGTYMEPNCNGSDPRTTPVGLCVDNGILVNKNLILDGLDGLAVVYPAGGGGGIAVTNLKEGNLKISDGGTSPILNIRNPFDLQKFITWSQGSAATVFQAHLFVYKNNFLLNSSRAKSDPAKRRVLAVGTATDGQVVHYIIDLPTPSSIYDAALKAFNYLTIKERLNITFMINLDTGCQDAFQVYKSDGTIDYQFRGKTSISDAANLLVYYFE